MSNWIRWWESKFFLTILGIALATMGVSFILAYFIEWGWMPSIAVACLGGIAMRRVFSKKMDEVAKDIENNNKLKENKDE